MPGGERCATMPQGNQGAGMDHQVDKANQMSVVGVQSSQINALCWLVDAIFLGHYPGAEEFIQVFLGGATDLVGHFLHFILGLAFDTALDIGTLIGVVWFFARVLRSSSTILS